MPEGRPSRYNSLTTTYRERTRIVAVHIVRVEDDRVEEILVNPSEFFTEVQQQFRTEVEAEFARDRGTF